MPSASGECFVLTAVYQKVILMLSVGSDSDTIRILLATDNHVGYNERDPIRGDDSWKSFHEVLCIAKERDVYDAANQKYGTTNTDSI